MSIRDLTFGSRDTFNSAAITINDVVEIGENKIIIGYNEGGTAKVICGTISGTTITWGTAVTIDTSNNFIAVCKVATDKFAVHYNRSSTTPKTKICTVSTRTITAGSEYTVGANVSSGTLSCAYLADNKVVYTYGGTSTTSQGTRVATISGTTPTLGTEIYIENGYICRKVDVCKIDTDKFAICFNYNNSNGRVSAYTVSGTTITKGSSVEFSNVNPGIVSIIGTGTDKFVIGYSRSGVAYAIAATVSGTTITKGSETLIVNNSTSYQSVCSTSDDSFVYIYSNISLGEDGYAVGATVSGTTITKGDIVEFEVNTTYELGSFAIASGNKFIISYRDGDNSSYGTAIIGEIELFTAHVKILTETITITESIKNSVSKVLNETISLTENITIIKILSKTISDTITTSDTIIKSTNKVLSDTVNITETFTRYFVRAISETITLTEDICADVLKIISETITITENFITTTILARILTETITITESIARIPVRIISEAITITENITKVAVLKKILTEAISMTEQMYGKINGVNIKWYRKYSEKVGTFYKKYFKDI